MNRERVRQVVLALIGLLYTGLIYPLASDLWHAKWLLQMNDNECEPMFLSFFISLGVFLLLSVKKPSAHRSLIAFAGWWSLGHASVMAIQTIEAWKLGRHRDPTDVVIAGILGIITLAAVPPKREPAEQARTAAP